MRDQMNRATTALNLLRRAIRDDDQHATDLLASIIENQELFLECGDDSGKSFTSMVEFMAELDTEGLQQEPLLPSAAQGAGRVA